MKAPVLLLVTIGIAAPAFSQSSFEVASIKPDGPDARLQIAIQPGGRFVANGVSLKALIAIAYHLQAFEMSGGDGWIANDRWSIEAKAEQLTAIPPWTPPNVPDVIAARLRSLMEDRFALKTHRETKEFPVYALVVGKNGSRMAMVDPPPQAVPGQQSAPAKTAPPPGRVLAGPGAITGSAITMNQLITLLNRSTDRPVIDETGLTGYFNVNLKFAPETAPVENGDPSIFTAIQEQLGLKLEARKEPVSVLVIDSAEKPAN